MTFKKLFLPVGILLAVGISLLLPQPGVWIKTHDGIRILIMMLFFLNGWSFSIGEIRSPLKMLPVLGIAVVTSLLLGPLTAQLLVSVLPLDPSMSVGLLVMSAMPTTLSSAIVITTVLHGNRVWAMFLTVGLNLLSILTVPLILPRFLDLQQDISVNTLTLLYKMLILVLVPFLCGWGFKKLVSPVKLVCAYLPSTCVILTVYAAFSASRDYLINFDYARLPIVLLGVVALHLLLLLYGAIATRFMKSANPERVAFMLSSAHKTLPMAVSILAATGIDDGLILIPCLLYHFLQLTIDTVLFSHVCKVRPE